MAFWEMNYQSTLCDVHCACFGGSAICYLIHEKIQEFSLFRDERAEKWQFNL